MVEMLRAHYLSDYHTKLRERRRQRDGELPVKLSCKKTNGLMCLLENRINTPFYSNQFMQAIRAITGGGPV